MDRRKTLVVRRRITAAFTLIELMLVISVMALLLGISGDFFGKSMRSQQLTATARMLAAELDHAALLAQKENRPIEVRFLRFAPSGMEGSTDAAKAASTQFRAYQLAVLTGFDASNRPQYRTLSEVTRFPTGFVMMPGAEFTTLDSLPSRVAGADDPQFGPAYSIVSFQINPDGTTTLPRATTPVLTLVEEEKVASKKLPPNYRSITIDPVNAHTRVY